jgi:hypothetical protein
LHPHAAAAGGRQRSAPAPRPAAPVSPCGSVPTGWQDGAVISIQRRDSGRRSASRVKIPDGIGLFVPQIGNWKKRFSKFRRLPSGVSEAAGAAGPFDLRKNHGPVLYLRPQGMTIRCSAARPDETDGGMKFGLRIAPFHPVEFADVPSRRSAFPRRNARSIPAGPPRASIAEREARFFSGSPLSPGRVRTSP